jgi:hypothetical protein
MALASCKRDSKSQHSSNRQWLGLVSWNKQRHTSQIGHKGSSSCRAAAVAAAGIAELRMAAMRRMTVRHGHYPQSEKLRECYAGNRLCRFSSLAQCHSFKALC